MNKKLSLETMMMHLGENRKEYSGAVVPPIYQNSLFTFESWEAIDEAFDNPQVNNIYTRGNNPSVTMVEAKIAAMAGGEKAKLFASGMGAISSSILHCIKAGDHVITINNVYGPTAHLLNVHLKEKSNIETTFLSGRSVEEFEGAIKENTSLIFLETPSSAVFSLQDIRAICDLAKKHNIKVIVDNTWATPIFQKPLELGADLEVHSCSKYIGGHSDIVSGVVIGSKSDIEEIFMNEHALYGAKMAPFEAWLLMRSLRTMTIRMKQHERSAMEVAKFLEDHNKVKSVMYPGLDSFPQKELAAKQMTGFSGVMGFEIDTDNLQEMKDFLNTLELFSIGVSWGGHESLAYVTAISYLKEMTEARFKETGLSLGTVRISVGLEDSVDLINDLDNALKCIK